MLILHACHYSVTQGLTGRPGDAGPQGKAGPSVSKRCCTPLLCLYFHTDILTVWLIVNLNITIMISNYDFSQPALDVSVLAISMYMEKLNWCRNSFQSEIACKSYK